MDSGAWDDSWVESRVRAGLFVCRKRKQNESVG